MKDTVKNLGDPVILRPIFHGFCLIGYKSLRAYSHDPGTTHCPGQLSDPRVNFASVNGLMTVTVHMSFSLLRGNYERWVTHCTTPGNPPFRGNFTQ